MSMTPEQFINHWQDNPLTERAGAQQHFDDLCDLLGVDKPRDPENYCFEKGARKDGGGEGWADVWKRDCFGWENKKPGRDLKVALAQLREYAGNLGNPPLLIVCDRERIEIHTAFRGYPDEPRTILLKDIGEQANLQTLKWVFTDPDKLKPLKSNAAITAEAAGQFAKLAKDLRDRSHRFPTDVDTSVIPGGRNIDPQQVAHFLTQCIFCMFAEDEGLLHNSATDNAEIFTGILKAARTAPDKAADRIKMLFGAMQKKGGIYGNDDIAWFNGGLFKTIQIPPLTASDVAILHDAAATLDWRAIDPTIFGTLFERGLDPSCRAQLGAHYTDVATINKLIEPLITRPLSAEWEAAKAQIATLIAKSGKTSTGKTYKAAANLYHSYLERLRNFRVLDAACGSGNFLYLALHALKDLEHRAQIDAEQLGLPKQLDIMVGTDNILGIETNEYAAELARLTVWIGDIQWCQRNGRPINKNPILRSLDGIQHRDALLNPDGSETDWPDADVIVGNPPFLGDKMMRGELGDTYVTTLRNCYKGRVPGGADLVCYWFDKARIQIERGKTQAAGLVSTNSIRGGSNRKVLERIITTKIPKHNSGGPYDDHKLRLSQTGGQTQNQVSPGNNLGESTSADTHRLVGLEMDDGGTPGECTVPGDEGVFLTIFEAWPDEGWFDAGTAVRVSLVCFGDSGLATTQLAGETVALIHADLTAGDGEENTDITKAKRLPVNAGASFQGPVLIGPFEIEYPTATAWFRSPNPNGISNSKVLRPITNGKDITSRSRGLWVVDFGSMDKNDAALFENPFEYVAQYVKPIRSTNPRPNRRDKWWMHGETGAGWRAATHNIQRYIATSQVSKYRFFVWQSAKVWPHQTVIAIARPDDTTFGILHSRFHELWALRLGTALEDRPRYTPTTCFETFPFPADLTPADTAPNKVGWAEQREAHQAEAATTPMGFISFSPSYGQTPVPAQVADAAAQIYADAIAVAAFKLNQLRENWLNPPEWADWVITPEEEKAGFPNRPVAKPGFEADLKKRTLTNLYNAKPAWLVNAHHALDHAVALAYGWTDYTPEMPDAEILQRLLKLNLAR